MSPTLFGVASPITSSSARPTSDYRSPTKKRNNLFSLLLLILTLPGGVIAAPLTSVKQVALKPFQPQIQRIKIHPQTACSITLPKKIKGIILGNTLDFVAERINDHIVSIKAKTGTLGLFTNLQLIIDERWIITVEIDTAEQADAISQLVFFEAGNDATTAEIEKKKQSLEKEYQLKEETMQATLLASEENKYIDDMLRAYRYVKLEGEKMVGGIRVKLQDATIRNGQRVYIKVELYNSSSQQYPIAQLEVIERREGGFLWRGTKEAHAVASRLTCLNDVLEIPAGGSTSCVVAFDLPTPHSSQQQIGLKLAEAANPSRQVYIRRIVELMDNRN